MPFFKDTSKIFVVITLTIIEADFLAIRVWSFIKTIVLYLNSEL